MRAPRRAARPDARCYPRAMSHDDATLRAAVAAFPPVWREVFAALRVDLSSEAGRAKLGTMRKLPLFGVLPTRVPAAPLCARIDSLAPLAHCTALTEIQISGAPVSDLEPLRGLAGLRQLVAFQTRIASLEPLSAMRKLRALYVWCTPLADLAPLSGLAALEELNVEYTGVGDLAPLAGLRNLRDLNISATAVVDLAPLTSVPLRSLTAYRTAIPEGSLAAFRSSHPECTVVLGDAYPPREVRCGC